MLRNYRKYLVLTMLAVFVFLQLSACSNSKKYNDRTASGSYGYYDNNPSGRNAVVNSRSNDTYDRYYNPSYGDNSRYHGGYYREREKELERTREYYRKLYDDQQRGVRPYIPDFDEDYYPLYYYE